MPSKNWKATSRFNQEKYKREEATMSADQKKALRETTLIEQA